ncbi:oxysterol-binding protein-related protein 2A isoform X1 [Elaeis guineensis]|uniref:Oxysterol-binding protein-related protein 2A isoform X1 n=3 Tax=Elaeis guineensis var. tenera TaxID=51953 RepID=A0A6I9R2S7_ELAGV|nr:oxysterol-binding protein-related protein 2A isoform X1 [Elaeis guineensis]XP_010919505.1 oxysterol-binding protein-related protein 2A isoform X1 [Elaeis guineensis]
MRAGEMHPLCCICMDWPGIGDRSPVPADPETELGGGGGGKGECEGSSSTVAVAGVLYKWTNYGKGWRSRWFSLQNGVLSYFKIPRREEVPFSEGDGVRLIGTAATRLSRANAIGSHRNPPKPVGVVYLKISSFRESKTDERRFYIVSPTKTLQLRTDSRKDRVAWIEALVSARSKFCLDGRMPFIQNDISISTKKLRDRMHVEGLDEELMRDCEQIMLSEFLEFQRQLKLHYEEHLSFLSTFQQQLEEVNADEVTTAIHEGQLQLPKHKCPCLERGKCSEYSTTESSDDVEKQELDELSDEGKPCFFDAEESFSDSTVVCPSKIRASDHAAKSCGTANCSGTVEMMDLEIEPNGHNTFPYIKRRTKLPDPLEKEKGVSLWSMIKDNVGKDLTRVCLPVYFNEPLSTLQKCFEDLEYSYLLDRAYEYGKMGNSLMRILNVAAFAVSGYASSDGRHCKPFNPLLGETYEADFPEKGIRFFSEKVSHHPMLIACHCEGKGWKFWGDSNLRSKFWGQTIQLDPVGVLTLKFDDGEIFQWSKVTTTIYNLILGKVYCNHHGTMNILGNWQYSCKLKFKDQSFLERNPRQVQGFIEDVNSTKVATLKGKWDDSMYYTIDDDMFKTKSCISTQNATLLWQRSKPPANPTRYNLSSFAIMLNELTSELQEKLPPTDSRLRPDQRYLENGEYEKANAEKQRLERRQRMSRKLQENGWKPRWFRKDSENGSFCYVGGYWEARKQKKWDDCPDIFGEFSEGQNVIP